MKPEQDRRFWTAHEINVLQVAWALGLPCKEIAARLPRHSHFAVAAKADRMGLRARGGHIVREERIGHITLAGPEWSRPESVRRAAA